MIESIRTGLRWQAMACCYRGKMTVCLIPNILHTYHFFPWNLPWGVRTWFVKVNFTYTSNILFDNNYAYSNYLYFTDILHEVSRAERKLVRYFYWHFKECICSCRTKTLCRPLNSRFVVGLFTRRVRTDSKTISLKILGCQFVYL